MARVALSYVVVLGRDLGFDRWQQLARRTYLGMGCGTRGAGRNGGVCRRGAAGLTSGDARQPGDAQHCYS